MAEPSVLLFVYGTLSPGAANPFSRLLWAGADDHGPATMPGLLYDCGLYPGFVDAPAPGPLVHGRLALVHDPTVIARLDAYEGDEYQRQPRQATRPDGATVEAHVYVFIHPTAGARIITSGRWPLQ